MKNYKRNNDLNYYLNNPCESNCGSYALRLEGWYYPEDHFEKQYGDIYTWIETNAELGCFDDWELSDIFAENLLDGILEEFKGELRLQKAGEEPKQNEELISFATFAYYSEEEGDSNYDFHFKVFRDGKWMEKNGWGPVHECSEWDWGDYISDVYYLIHKIK